MTCKVFKALFDFKGTTERTLGFKQNDLLTVVQPIDENWYFGCFGGAYGFIPKKYVKECEEKSYVYMKDCVSACIDKLQRIPEKDATKDDHSALKKLRKCLDSLASEAVKESGFKGSAATAMSTSPPLPPPPPSPQSNGGSGQQRRQKPPAPSPPKLTAAAAAAKSPAAVRVPANLSRQLVEAVRASTGAPHGSCVEAVKKLLVTLDSQLSEQSDELAGVVRQLAEQMMAAASADVELDSTVTSSRDWKAFDRLLSMAESRRRDWQERGGWPLHEQEGQVVEDLTQLAELLTSSEASVARRRIRCDGCAAPLCLAELHAAETRPAVRLALIDCLAAMCALDRAVVDALLGHSSLAGDLLAAAGTVSVGTDLLTQSLNLLALLFSAHIRPSNAVFDALSEQFFVRLLARLSPADGEGCDESLAQSAVAFLLTANSLTSEYSALAAAAPAHDERPLLRALVTAPSASCQVFTESLLVAFNRADDPAALLKHSPPPHDSVMKMLTDLFSHESTAALFYSGDVHVMLDVIIRELYNASPDSKKLPPLLLLLQRCVSTARYRAAAYKSADLRMALRQLSGQDVLPEAVRAQCDSVAQLLANGGAV